MIKRLIAALLLLPAAAWAQNQGQIVPNGKFTPGHTMRAQNSTGTVAVDGGGSAGSNKNGVGYLTEIGITNTGTPFCISDALINAQGGYHQFCLGANALGGGLISYNAVGGASPLALNFNINGTTYPFPGPGAGNVLGPNSSTMNELASFNNTNGSLLRQGGLSSATDNQTTGITSDGYALAGFSQTSTRGTGLTNLTAQQIFEWAIGPGSTPAPLYDTVRGVSQAPTGTTVLITNSVGGYMVNSAGRPGPPYSPFPAAAAINGIGICDADGCGTWGINTIVSDNRGQVISSHGPRFLFGGEFDVQPTSTATQVSGVSTGGSSLVQPAAANGFSCLYLDGAAAAGSVAKWTGCYESQNGSATAFAIIGAAAASGTSINSQDINFNFFDGAGIARNTSLAQTPGGMLLATNGAGISGSFVIPAGAVFGTGDAGGMQISTHTAVVGLGTVLGFGSDAAWTGVNLGNNSGTTGLEGTVAIPNVTTGTPVASLCIDASNHIIKKTTTGPCV